MLGWVGDGALDGVLQQASDVDILSAGRGVAPRFLDAHGFLSELGRLAAFHQHHRFSMK